MAIRPSAPARTAATIDTSAALVVKIDTVAPTAPTIATPTANANGGLNLTGSAEANSLVQVYDGTTWIGSTNANQNGTWGLTSATLSPGSHSLTAKATDAAGNTGAASSVVTASTGTGQAPTSPAAPTIASFSNDSGTAGDRITNDNTLTLTGSAAAGSTVKVFDGTTQIGTATANSSGAWSYTTPALANGNHNLTATATTSSGTSSASSALAVKIDTTAPTTPTMATPTANASGSLNVKGTAAEADSLVQVFDGTTWIGSTIANQNGTWGFNSAKLSTGSHNLTAKATDAAGNTSATSSVITVSTGTSSPTSPASPTIASFSNDSGIAGDRMTNDNTLTLTGSAAAGSTVKVFDGTTQIGTATANSSGAWSHTTTALANGNHSLTATATTSSGTSSASSTLAVKIDTTAPTTPTIATPTANANGSLNVKGTAAEADSLVQVFDGTTWIGSTIANQNGTWALTSAKLSSGSHDITAKVTDAAGNIGAASSVVKVSTGTTSPSGPPSTFPDASTTGVPPGTSLTTVNGNFSSSFAGQIIDARDVNGIIYVNHPGVIIRNCEAQGITVNADNVTIQDLTITGLGLYRETAINLLGSDNTTIQRCDISNVENGIWLEANGCLIADNYLHDLTLQLGNRSAH